MAEGACMEFSLGEEAEIGRTIKWQNQVLVIGEVVLFFPFYFRRKQH